MSNSTPRKIIVDVKGCKGTAKGFMAYFSIKDTGTGIRITIEPPLANFILDPFLQSKDTTNEND